MSEHIEKLKSLLTPSVTVSFRISVRDKTMWSVRSQVECYLGDRRMPDFSFCVSKIDFHLIDKEEKRIKYSSPFHDLGMWVDDFRRPVLMYRLPETEVVHYMESNKLETCSIEFTQILVRNWDNIKEDEEFLEKIRRRTEKLSEWVLNMDISNLIVPEREEE